MQLPYQLLGLIVHGFRTFAFCFYGDQGMSKMNLVCGAILFAINSYLAANGRLPDELHLLMDNCPSDNKNHVVFGFLNHLVALGIFSRIVVCLEILLVNRLQCSKEA